MRRNRARWVLELLDPANKQVNGTLIGRTTEGEVLGYCCLGLACQLVAPNSTALLPDAWDPTFRMQVSKRGTMHDTTAWEFGLTEDDQDIAADWNDSWEWDFPRIARMVAWITSEGHASLDGVRWVVNEGNWGEDLCGWDEVEAIIPSDFDSRAWAEGVLA